MNTSNRSKPPQGGLGVNPQLMRSETKKEKIKKKLNGKLIEQFFFLELKKKLGTLTKAMVNLID